MFAEEEPTDAPSLCLSKKATAEVVRLLIEKGADVHARDDVSLLRPG
jgi:hypothetical protein